MVLSRFLTAAFLASIASASPLHARNNASSPCAKVASAVAAQPNAATPTVSAGLAYECITSVPIEKTAALKLINSIAPYFKWQSTTAWLKDPPLEYSQKIQPAVDIWGEWQKIKSKVENGSYHNEFEFGFDLYTLGQSTHDGHFVYVPDSVGGIFNWARPVPLVSVSSDGKELPKPYVYSDVLAESFGNSTFKPSPISKINGKPATQYLEEWSQLGSLQDRDALYNNVFYELATVSLGPVGSGTGTFAGSGRGRWAYPGSDTELEFENGTTYKFDNFARVLVSFDGVTDGKSLYDKYFAIPSSTSSIAATPSNSTTPTSSASPTATATSIPAPGYPPPVFRQSSNLIGGYYLEDEYSDIAVLSVPSFVSDDSAEIPFQQVGEKFLAAAKAAGKKKLIIDVSANGGGTILQGYDLYKQLFPDNIDHAAGDRFRAHEATDLLGQYFSKFSESIPREYVTEGQNETLYTLESEIVSSLFNYQTDLDVNNKPFPSWPAKYGPVQRHDDEFSNLFRWNLSDVLTPYNSGGIYIHGYGNLTNVTQPFAAEDVVVVTDGYCASTCTIFSELMRQRAGVKYISLGGRSKEGITQAIGGVKGTNNFPWSYIQELAQIPITLLTNSTEGAHLNTTELGEYWDNTPFQRAAAGTSINVNFRDGIRDGDETETPLQFVYEPSDCRILYTKAMTYDVTAIWKAVADSAFGGTSHCIAGGLGETYGKRSVKGELTVQDKIYSRSVHQWRREMASEDYPLDVYTDLSGINLNRHGIMWP